MVDSKGFPSSTDVDKKVGDRLNWTRDNATHYLTYEDQHTHLIVKERRWIPPSEGKRKLMELLKNHFNAERLPDLKGKMRWKIVKTERRKAEAPPSPSGEASSTSTAEKPKPAKLPLSQLQNNVLCPRSQRANINDLLESIPHEGLRERLIVRPHPNKAMATPMYQIVSGHRRYRALEELGWTEAPVTIKDMTDREARVLAAKSNMEHGQSMAPLEEARWIEEELIGKEGMSEAEVGKELGRSQQWVSKRRCLLGAPKHVTTLVVTLPGGEKIEVPYSEKPYACFLCEDLGTHFPIFIKHKPVCKKCVEKPDFERRLEDKIKETTPSTPPTKTETKEYKPPDDRPWKEKLKADPSNFELRVEKKLQLRKMPMGERHGLITLPFKFADRIWRLPKGTMIWRANGLAHKGKEDKADRICQALRVLGVRVVETWYERDCEKAADEALDKIERNLREMGWNG